MDADRELWTLSSRRLCLICVSEREYTTLGVEVLPLQAVLLVIDDLGASRENDFERMSIFEVVNKRYEEMKPTVSLGCQVRGERRERASDRLREGGGFVLFEWESARRGTAGRPTGSFCSLADRRSQRSAPK